jgi:hypothetical protein
VMEVNIVICLALQVGSFQSLQLPVVHLGTGTALVSPYPTLIGHPSLPVPPLCPLLAK